MILDKAREDAADQRLATTPQLLGYLPHIVAYPLTGHALAATAMFTGLLWIGFQNAAGIALIAIVSPWVLHYAEAVVERSAQGHALPPQFGGDMIYLGNLSALRPLVGAGLVATAYFSARQIDEVLALAVLGLGVFLFPAFMLILAAQDSLLDALNPLRHVQVIAGVGPAYILVCAILAAAVAAAGAVAGQVSLALTLLGAIYLLIAVCHLLGYVAYHRAEQLGLAVRVQAYTAERRREDEQAQRLAAVLAKIDAAVAQKDDKAAGDALFAEPGGPANVLQFHEALFDKLHDRHHTGLILTQGARLITALLAARHADRALDICEQCYDRDRRFETETTVQLPELAQRAFDARRWPLLERLTQDAAGRFGADPIVVPLGFLRARYYSETVRDDARAWQVLQPLLAAERHPLAPQIRALAKAINPVQP